VPRLYIVFRVKLTPREVNRVANLPERTVMINFRREDLAFRTTKQGRRNRGNERKINRRTRISRKSIEALASFQVSMHCNLSKQK